MVATVNQWFRSASNRFLVIGSLVRQVDPQRFLPSYPHGRMASPPVIWWRSMRTLFCAGAILAVSMPLLVSAQQPALLPQNLGIKYMRDSQEYATLARQVYRAAELAVRTAAPRLKKGSWVVSLDIDETA